MKMRLILTVILFLIYPLINANANKVKNCSIQPSLETRDSQLILYLYYTAAVVNNTEKCIEEGVVNFNVENNKALNKSATININKCPGGAGSYSQYVKLVDKRKIKPENFDAELASVDKLFNQLLSTLSKNNASCEWYPK